MSRGLSVFQRKAMAAVKKRGVLDILDLREIAAPFDIPSEIGALRRSLWQSDRAHAEGECRCPSRRECRANNRLDENIRGFASLQRAMRSLERRGLVAVITNHKPRTWLLPMKNKKVNLSLPMALIMRHATTRLVLKSSEGWKMRAFGKTCIFKNAASP